MKKGLGLNFRPDMRRGLYRMGDYLKERYAGYSIPDERVWDHGRILDQGNEGTCVGHAWVAWENCRPLGYARQQGHNYALAWYDRATELDPFSDNDHDRQSGTTTQAGVSVAIEWGLATSYVWASTFDEISTFIRAEGPVVWGTNWYESMFDPGLDAYIDVDPSSGLAGGHEWMMFGAYATGDSEAQQSWGEFWGDSGIMRFDRSSVETLIGTGAECCACLQTAVPAR